LFSLLSCKHFVLLIQWNFLACESQTRTKIGIQIHSYGNYGKGQKYITNCLKSWRKKYLGNLKVDECNITIDLEEDGYEDVEWILIHLLLDRVKWRLLFIIYLLIFGLCKTLPISKITRHRMIEWLIYNESEWMWKEVVMA
jgi:hypothetical protein